jgi:peroxiredoxin
MALSVYVSTEKSHLSDNLYKLSLPTLDGQNKALSEWRATPLVVNFWATWCSPCVEEMPALSALQTELKQSGQAIQLIGIGIDSPENIAEFAKKYKITYPLYIAGMPGTQLSQQLGNQTGGLPFTIIINKSGDIVKTYSGRLSMPALRKDLAGL